MDWDMQKIQNWNKYRFPKNTIVKQRRKVEEEIAEFNDALSRKDKLEELADVYIAFAGLSRFSSIGAFVCKLFEHMPDYDMLRQAVDIKMGVNVRRRFDKNMHHIGQDAIPMAKDDWIANPKSGIANPEYITVKKVFNYWKQDAKGNWHRCQEPYEFQVIKSECYKGE